MPIIDANNSALPLSSDEKGITQGDLPALPNEILLHIFSFLGDEQKKAALTSKVWLQALSSKRMIDMGCKEVLSFFAAKWPDSKLGQKCILLQDPFSGRIFSLTSQQLMDELLQIDSKLLEEFIEIATSPEESCPAEVAAWLKKAKAIVDAKDGLIDAIANEAEIDAQTVANLFVLVKANKFFSLEASIKGCLDKVYTPGLLTQLSLALVNEARIPEAQMLLAMLDAEEMILGVDICINMLLYKNCPDWALDVAELTLVNFDDILPQVLEDTIDLANSYYREGLLELDEKQNPRFVSARNALKPKNGEDMPAEPPRDTFERLRGVFDPVLARNEEAKKILDKLKLDL